MKRFASIIALGILTLAACSTNDDAVPAGPNSSTPVTIATSSLPSSTTTSSTTPAMPTITSESDWIETTSPESVEQIEPQEITATCATDYSLYQLGTTFYSDGTSGYTVECQQQMEAAMQSDPAFANYPTDNEPFVRTPAQEAEKAAGHAWWSNCVQENTAEFCRANDPWQQ